MYISNEQCLGSNDVTGDEVCCPRVPCCLVLFLKHDVCEHGKYRSIQKEKQSLSYFYLLLLFYIGYASVQCQDTHT